MTQQERELYEYLVLLRDSHLRNLDLRHNLTQNQWHYKGPADLLVREASWFSTGPSSKNLSGTPKQCFVNAASYALRHHLRYVEGYATAIIPVHHAWCADSRDNVYEVTWDKMGLAYFGIEFEPMRVRNGSVLFNPHNDLDVYLNALERKEGVKR